MELYKRVIADTETGLIDIYVAAEKILKWANEHSFENNQHPMLYEVSDLSFDITEDYRTEEADRADWETITNTIKQYAEGNWEPTCWILSAMYGEYLGGKLIHSFSVAVRRQNGGTTTETASGELKRELAHVIEKVNTVQTDERYLQNLAKLFPRSTKKHKLTNIDVAEYLTKPYHSTA